MLFYDLCPVAQFFFEDELQFAPIVASHGVRQLVAEIGPVMGLLAGQIRDNATRSPDASPFRSIVVVPHTARPDDRPTALQGVDFLTIEELTARVALEPHSASDDKKCGRLFHGVGVSRLWPCSGKQVFPLAHRHRRRAMDQQPSISIDV